MNRRRVPPVAGVVMAGLAAGAVHTSPALAATVGPAAAAPTLSIGHPIAPPGPASRISRILRGGNGHWYDQNFGAWNPRTQSVFGGFARAERTAGITQQRYPSGTAANLFDWQHAIGPVAQRPRQLGYSNGLYTAPTDDDFGLDEWARDGEAMDQPGDVMVNATTQDAEQAAAEVQYLTGSVRSRQTFDGRNWARVRAANGHRAPYPDIRYWEIGNELGNANQLYWRAGTPVDDRGHALTGVDSTDLYAFGGATRLTDQPVGVIHDFRPAASVSTGAPRQHVYAEYPPVADFGSVTVRVAGDPTTWTPVASLADQSPDARVFMLDRATGEITFGDGRHGAIPAAHEQITVSYTSGPHDGFVDFYREMKRADPHIRVCLGLSDEHATEELIRDLAARHAHFDCIEHHAYISAKNDGFPTSGSVAAFYEHVIAGETEQLGEVTRLQQAIDDHPGAATAGTGIAMTEYGNNGTPPDADPDFGGSVGEAVLMGDDLIAWSRLGIPEADKSNLNGFATGAQPANPLLYPVDATMLSKTSLIQRTKAGGFTVSSTGRVSGLFAPLTGGRPAAVSVARDPAFPGDASLRDLNAIASRQPDGRLDLLVVNRDPAAALTATVRTGSRGGRARLATVEGPALTSMSPGGVRTATATAPLRHGVLRHRFPAHSVTRIEVAGR